MTGSVTAGHTYDLVPLHHRQVICRLHAAACTHCELTTRWCRSAGRTAVNARLSTDAVLHLSSVRSLRIFKRSTPELLREVNGKSGDGGGKEA